MAKGEMPEVIFVGAIGKGEKKARFLHTLLEVIDRYPDGTPKTCMIRRNDEVIDLEVRMKELGRNVEFITAYVPAVNFKGEK